MLDWEAHLRLPGLLSNELINNEKRNEMLTMQSEWDDIYLRSIKEHTKCCLLIQPAPKWNHMVLTAICVSQQYLCLVNCILRIRLSH